MPMPRPRYSIMITPMARLERWPHSKLSQYLVLLCLLGMTSDGYIPLPALLTHMKHKPTEEEVRAVVSCDAKVATCKVLNIS